MEILNKLKVFVNAGLMSEQEAIKQTKEYWDSYDLENEARETMERLSIPEHKGGNKKQ